jgi:hypothetical protein
MKTSRDQLKALMKELLVEILNEGLGGVNSSPSAGRPQQPTGRAPVGEQRQLGGRRKPAFDPKLDTRPAGGFSPSNTLKEAIRIEAGGNPMMADILADTAMKTLPQQLANGDRMGQPSLGSSMSPASFGGGSPGAGQEQFNGDPSEMFEGGAARSDGSSHWADLAFMPAKKLA